MFLKQEKLGWKGAAGRPEESAAGAKEFSPARIGAPEPRRFCAGWGGQRWESVVHTLESQRDGRGMLIWLAYGTRILWEAYPALKRWAKLFRPVSGTRLLACALLAILLALSVIRATAETGSNASVVSGTVADPTGAVVAGATVEIHNPVSKFQRSATTDGAGHFSFANVPLNTYHLSVSATGFSQYVQDLDLRSAVPLNLKITLE